MLVCTALGTIVARNRVFGAKQPKTMNIDRNRRFGDRITLFRAQGGWIQMTAHVGINSMHVAVGIDHHKPILDAPKHVPFAKSLSLVESMVLGCFGSKSRIRTTMRIPRGCEPTPGPRQINYLTKYYHHTNPYIGAKPTKTCSILRKT